MTIQHRNSCPSHCCPKHGCKYGYDDCPVVLGTAQPTYPNNNGCEMCEWKDPYAEIERLQAENEALRKDARRYAFLRDDKRADVRIPWVGKRSGDDLDALIDIMK
jgi:hypothetical protein